MSVQLFIFRDKWSDPEPATEADLRAAGWVPASEVEQLRKGLGSIQVLTNCAWTHAAAKALLENPASLSDTEASQ